MEGKKLVGKPKKVPTGDYWGVTTRLKTELVHAMDAAAEEHGISRSRVVEIAVRKLLFDEDVRLESDEELIDRLKMQAGLK